jgi:hypothetical protein
MDADPVIIATTVFAAAMMRLAKNAMSTVVVLSVPEPLTPSAAARWAFAGAVLELFKMPRF